jgi:hypothetical protein
MMPSGQITFFQGQPVLAVDLVNAAQVETHLQLLSNLLLDGLDLATTDQEPRWGAHGFDVATGETMRGRHTDLGFDPSVLAETEAALGYPLKPGVRTGLGFWAAALYDPTTSQLAGTADHRITGRAFAD